MHKGFFFILIGLLVVVGCSTPDDPADQPPTVATITILPPLEQTPPTATLEPSNTATATATASPITPSATPTNTATSTATPTPPIVGEVVTSGVNVRAEPSNRAEIITRLQPGDAVEVQYASEDQEWYFVIFVDDEGQILQGWMTEQFVDTGERIAPTFGPTPTHTATPSMTPGPGTPTSTFVSPTPSFDFTPGPDLSDENVRANCREVGPTPPSISADETVSIWWSWFVAEPELMTDHLQFVRYEILLDGSLLMVDGVPITDYTPFQTEMVREEGDWFVYWYVPVGELVPGRHEVTYSITWTQAVNDGYEDFGPGTDIVSQTGSCVFTVSEN